MSYEVRQDGTLIATCDTQHGAMRVLRKHARVAANNAVMSVRHGDKYVVPHVVALLFK